MPVLPSDRLPKYCCHKQSGQAVVYIDGRDILLGRHGSAESRQRYNTVVAEWIASGRQLPPPPQELTVVELIDRFWAHAKRYYVHPDGSPTSEQGTLKDALRPLKELYGMTPAAEFGPLALKALRERMIAPRKVIDPKTKQEVTVPGWARRHTNKQIARIKHVFKWAVGEQLIAPSVHQALATVEGLRLGRTGARETERVKPVDEAHVLAIKPFVSRQVWAIVQLQMLTGARGGEILIMRGCDIDTGVTPWAYRPSSHKTQHHGHERIIHLGPKARRIVKQFLKADLSAFLFSPADAEAERRAKRHADRKTPLSCGNVPGSNVKRRPEHKPRDRYGRDSYARAIARACVKANEWAKGGRVIWNDERVVPHWHPHQLRHTAATKIRRTHGLEAVRTVLGQRSDAVAEVYAERDHALAASVATRLG